MNYEPYVQNPRFSIVNPKHAQRTCIFVGKDVDHLPTPLFELQQGWRQGDVLTHSRSGIQRLKPASNINASGILPEA